MKCGSFPNDIYALYALGLADFGDHEQVTIHLRRNCSTCTTAVREAHGFWHLFASSTSQHQRLRVIGPSSGLKNRILQAIGPVGMRKTVIPSWTWTRVAAGGVIALGVSATSWNVGRSLVSADLKEASSKLADAANESERLGMENQNLRARLDAAQSTPQGPAARPVLVQNPALEKELAALRTQEAAIEKDLDESRAKAVALERDLNDRGAKLQLAERHATEIERSLQQARSDSQQALAERAAALSQKESELAALRVRIGSLEQQVTVYRRALDAQQQKLGQQMQLASMLQSPSVSLVRLRSTEAGQFASATALIADRSRLVFYASNLPALPAGRVYQLWLIRDRGPAILSGGLFSVDSASIEFQDAAKLAGLKGLAVTDEPAGGSPLPTGHKFLVGTPAS